MERPKQPYPPSVTEEGPAIRPSGPLLEWLDRESAGPGERRRFRLPVVVRYNARLGFTAAFVGVADDPGAEPITLRLDDSAMGRSLIDILEPHCPPDGNGCAFWLEGYWGPFLDPEPPADPGSPRRWPFSVVRYHGAIAPGSLRAESTHALLESSVTRADPSKSGAPAGPS